MKRICASLGLVAVGVASIQSIQAQSTDPSRAWSVSASLRGFYDDNANTAAEKADRIDSFGFEVRPAVSFSLPLEQTTIAGGYTYNYKWYDEAVNGRADHDDHTHTFAAQLRHAFSERFIVSLQDSFVIGQEPDVLRVANTALGTYQRIPGNNIRNYGSIVFSAQITPKFGAEAGYGNSLFDYEDEDYAVVRDDGTIPGFPIPGSFTGIVNNPVAVFGSRSGLLDRMEHLAHLDGRWRLLPNTIGIVGYQFGFVDYTDDQPIGVLYNTFPTPNTIVTSRARNSSSHYGYLGLEHSFRPDLVGNLRGGFRYTDYYNSPDDEKSVSPYVQGSLRWTYAKESSLDVGFSHDQSATDQFSVSGDSITHDADSTVAYLSVTHRIAPKLYGSAIGNFQYSKYNGGDFDQSAETYWGIGVNLKYQFNRHVSADVGYNYDNLSSDLKDIYNRDFDRNRVYVGATFIY